MNRGKSVVGLAVVCSLLSLLLSIPAGAADGLCELVLDDCETECTHTLVSKGRYRNWAGVSSVSQFADEAGRFCFAVDEGSQVTVYKTDGGRVTETVRIENPYDSFGGAVCGSDGCLYLVWGRNNSAGDVELPTIFVGKYTADGSLVAMAGGTGSEGMASYYPSDYRTMLPFSGGNCDVAINGDILMVDYARKMYNGHQADTVFAVNTGTMDVINGFVCYHSHSFDQRVTPYSKTGGFLLGSQGDTYPRGFSLIVTDRAKSSDGVTTFRFWTERDAYKNGNMSQLNTTYARLGNVLETNEGIALIGSSARSLSEEAKTEPYDVFVQVMDLSGKLDEAGGYITAGERSGLSGINGDTSVTDYGVSWLTDLADSGLKADVVQAVGMDGDRILVLYELSRQSGYYTTYDSTWYVLLNGDGSVFHGPESLGQVRLNPDEDPVYAQGMVQWVSNADGASTLTLHRVRVEMPETGVMGDGGPEWTYWKGTVSVDGPVSAGEPVVAAFYREDGAMISAKWFDRSGEQAAVPEGSAAIRLFWLDANHAPKCPPTAVQ